MKPLVMGFSFLGFFCSLLGSCESWSNRDPTLLERFKLSLVFFHIRALNETKPSFDNKSQILPATNNTSCKVMELGAAKM